MNELKEGRRLSAIYGFPAGTGERLSIRVYPGAMASQGAAEIVVTLEAGAFGPVPWARVQWPNGVELVNLATVESVVLDGPTPAAPIEFKGGQG